ncbi:nicotinate-nucleotide--dimethylbenzimidazole phosphoribosyltransferase [Bermanella sp. R86510]|uniref:nicotinate-nucleotide--dimethylbenzimidazole phosphoribosyltransferase n=1 Tax=unclassified Bermanella TaxID=2627862 RepID=UPI0037C9EA51
MNWFEQEAPQPSAKYYKLAQQHQLSLTKPPGSLGQLEEVACQLAAMQSQVCPSIDKLYISIFAGDHGIAKQNVSAFPQSVTTQMIGNFLHGGAAISVLANRLNAPFEVINCGCLTSLEDNKNLVNTPVSQATHDFSKQPAMSEAQLLEALDVGKSAAERACASGAQMFIGGEMGIANTTSAAALAAAQLGLPALDLVGPGTGVTPEVVAHKARVIDTALAQYSFQSPLERLQTVGGFEVAGLVGAYIYAAQHHLPVLIDGFISTVAALMAASIQPSVRPWFIFSHASAEPGHQVVLRALNAKPMLSIGMRLGEGSGAAVVVDLLRSAVALHNSMATFTGAGVDQKQL